MKKKILGLAIATAFMTFGAHAMVSSEMTSVAHSMGAKDVSEIKFDAGSTSLTEAQMKEISDAVAAAKAQGNVDKVRVLAWSDKEYPQVKTKYDKADIDLAERRLKDVQRFLKDKLSLSTVETYNMAERPGKLQNMFKTKDAKVKNTAEAGGAAPRTTDETGLFGLKGQSSKAVLMIFMK